MNWNFKSMDHNRSILLWRGCTSLKNNPEWRRGSSILCDDIWWVGTIKTWFRQVEWVWYLKDEYIYIHIYYIYIYIYIKPIRWFVIKVWCLRPFFWGETIIPGPKPKGFQDFPKKAPWLTKLSIALAQNYWTSQDELMHPTLPKSGWWFQIFLFSPLFGEDSRFD